MNNLIRVNNIITIHGIFLKDLNNLIEIKQPKTISPSDFAECIRSNSYTTYSSIPKKYVQPKDWPKMTDIKCWNCDRNFNKYPKFIPINPQFEFVSGVQIVTWEPHGNFCEWNCAVAYLEKEFSKDLIKNIKDSLFKIASEFSGKKILTIIPSPSKTIMKQYCGNNGITERQYQDLIDKLNTDYDLGCYKLEHLREL
jgi:hypothetical protein